jgi:hypothetical protein
MKAFAMILHSPVTAIMTLSQILTSLSPENNTAQPRLQEILGKQPLLFQEELATFATAGGKK